MIIRLNKFKCDIKKTFILAEMCIKEDALFWIRWLEGKIINSLLPLSTNWRITSRHLLFYPKATAYNFISQTKDDWLKRESKGSGSEYSLELDN